MRTHRNLPSPTMSASLLVGTELALIRNYVSEPQYSKGKNLHANWRSVEDGESVNVATYIQTYGDASISFSDSGRFISELQHSSGNVRLPMMPRLIHKPGVFVASTSPLSVDMDDVERELGAVLSEAGFTYTDHDLYRLPCYVYYLGPLTLGSILGEDWDEMSPLVEQFKRFGPGESMLQALQLDPQKRHLQSLGDFIGTREEIGHDEVRSLLDILELSNIAQLGVLMNQVHSLGVIPNSRVISDHSTQTDLAVLHYYAQLDNAYIINFPHDVLQAFGSAGANGMVTLSSYGGAQIEPHTFEIEEGSRALIPTIGSITTVDWEIIQKARVLYRFLMLARYCDIKNYPFSRTTQIKQADRRGFFEFLL